jgi:hypothetical protein
MVAMMIEKIADDLQVNGALVRLSLFGHKLELLRGGRADPI